MSTSLLLAACVQAPHTLAARLPGCLAALCVYGLAPCPAEGLGFFAGFGEDSECIVLFLGALNRMLLKCGK